MHRRELLSAAVVAAPAIMVSARNEPALAQTSPGLIIRNVTGTAGETQAIQNDTFTGRVRIKSIDIDRQTRTLKLTGVINGTVTRPNGSVIALVTSRAFVADGDLSAPTGVSVAAVCPILNLRIGRIRLNVLGLFINLEPISLDILALSGAGALLGNLLCALAGLLDNPTSLLSTILSILQQINSILAANTIVV